MTNLDRVFEIVSKELPGEGVDCLLIGGFAVNRYGYTRNTLDVDFMIVSERLADVRRIMVAAGFIKVELHETVVCFSVPNELDVERDIRPLCDRFGSPEVYRSIANQIEGLRTS